jgi:hypothetical protein
MSETVLFGRALGLLRGRKKAIDEATGAASQPAPPPAQVTPTPPSNGDDAIGQALDELDKKYAKPPLAQVTPTPPPAKMKDGGVIERNLLKQKAVVKQKRGC